jgi:hypothetical protein
LAAEILGPSKAEEQSLGTDSKQLIYPRSSSHLFEFFPQVFAQKLQLFSCTDILFGYASDHLARNWTHRVSYQPSSILATQDCNVSFSASTLILGTLAPSRSKAGLVQRASKRHTCSVALNLLKD